MLGVDGAWVVVVDVVVGRSVITLDGRIVVVVVVVVDVVVVVESTVRVVPSSSTTKYAAEFE